MPRPPAPIALATAEQAVSWLRSCVAVPMPGQLRTDSRQVQAGDIFVAWPGARHDGRQHVAAAFRAGAVACLIEAEGAEAFTWPQANVGMLPGLKAQAGRIAHQWNGRPSEEMQVLAVTGTNGKTSTSWWLAQALAGLGQRCAVVGTLGVGEVASGGEPLTPLQATGLTTPDAVTLHTTLRGLRNCGALACAMEASSIGLMEHRLDGLHIDVALFTNLTQDHLDYHGSMQAYAAAKERLFHWPELRAAVLNVDDPMGLTLANDARRRGLQAITVSLSTEGHDAAAAPTLSAANLHLAADGLTMDVLEAGASATVHCRLVGRFNASNVLMVIGGLRALGHSLPHAAQAVAGLRPVPGRMHRVEVQPGHASGTGVEVIVDYAHTPDALRQVLQALGPVTQQRAGRLWCVVGCGGDRDPGKRPLMGGIAQELAQHVVLTSDNPRSEDPERIISDMLAGCPQPQEVRVVADRRAAIRHAVEQARPGDVVLVAGKGHESTQEVAGLKLPFSDVEEARLALVGRGAGLAGGLVIEPAARRDALFNPPLGGLMPLMALAEPAACGFQKPGAPC